jgi:hypothetical protein
MKVKKLKRDDRQDIAIEITNELNNLGLCSRLYKY